MAIACGTRGDNIEISCNVDFNEVKRKFKIYAWKMI